MLEGSGLRAATGLLGRFLADIIAPGWMADEAWKQTIWYHLLIARTGNLGGRSSVEKKICRKKTRSHVRAESFLALFRTLRFNYSNSSAESTLSIFFLLYATVSHFSSTACRTFSLSTQGQNEFQSWIMASNEIIPK